MSKYNRFGKVAADVTKLYPGTVTADYDNGGANGATNIEGALDRAVFEIAASLTPAVFRSLTTVDAQEVVSYATQGQTSFSLGMAPVVSGSVHLWIYPMLPPLGGAYGDTYLDSCWYQKPTLGYNEVSASEYVVNVTNGSITYSGRTLQAGERVYASYNVDMDSATFASPMLGQIAVLGAAAELGEQLYSTATQEWALVTQYRERFNRFLEQLKDGTLIPDEVRRLKYFEEIERSNSEVRSIRLSRG